jgi:hypothetical protein
VVLGNLRHRRVIGFAQDVNHLLFSKPRLLDAFLAYRKRFPSFSWADIRPAGQQAGSIL